MEIAGNPRRTRGRRYSANFWVTYAPESIRPIISEFGAALIVAAVIGGTVDLFFKDEFARDAFVAAFRYVLPDELKEEVLRIISYKFLCTESRVLIEIEPIPKTELVKISIRTERTVRNITRGSENTPVIFALDNWGFNGHDPKIEECSFDVGNGWEECSDKKHHDDPVIERWKSNVSIRPGETFKIASRGYDVHRENSALRLFHVFPAKNPIVTVRAPPNFIMDALSVCPMKKCTHRK